MDDGERGLVGAIDIAARIGMESTGVTLPLAKLASQIADPAREPNPILIGRTGALLQSLNVLTPTDSGQGLVRIVPAAFGTFPAIIVTGADDAGVRAAANHLAGHLPYLGKPRRGETSYGDIEGELGQFFKVKSSAGQAAAALAAIDEVAWRRLKTRQIATLDARVYTEDERTDLAKLVEGRLKTQFSGAAVSASAPSRYGPVPVFDETLELPWEVTEFWKRFRAESVLPRVTAGATASTSRPCSASRRRCVATSSEARQGGTDRGGRGASGRPRDLRVQAGIQLAERRRAAADQGEEPEADRRPLSYAGAASRRRQVVRAADSLAAGAVSD